MIRNIIGSIKERGRDFYNNRRVINKFPSRIDPPLGNALLIYITYPFFLKKNSQEYRSHINIRNSHTIVRAFNELGFNVDIINHEDGKYDTNKKYDMVIGVGQALDRDKNYLKNSKVKIYYATGLHWLTESYLIFQRYLYLKNRKGTSLIPQRLNKPYLSAEKSDIIFSVQNNYTNETYAHLKKPIVYIAPTGSFDTGPQQESIKNKNSKKILWLSGVGMVLKGLDLVLEAFSELPAIELMICADFSTEPGFADVYSNELNQKNIQYLGFVDIGSEKFKSVTDQCIGVIYPYPEGEISGSIINAMYFGLIPIIAYCSNAEISNFAVPTCPSVLEIKKSLEIISSMSDSEIRERSEKCLKYIYEYHSPQKEADDWRSAIQFVIDQYLLNKK